MYYLTLMKYLWSIGVLLILSSCNTQLHQSISDVSGDQTTTPLSIRADDEQAIRAVMAMQETAWSAGDLDAFMEGYWNSEDLVFVGRNGPQYGWQTTLENYKKGYPDLSAMGKLQFDILRIRPISQDAYSMIGKYTLIRADDEPSGYFTLIWRKIDGKWLIVSDHTSG